MAKKVSRTKHKNVQDIETVIKNVSLGMNETQARVGTSITRGMRDYYKQTLSGLKQAVAHAKKHYKKVDYNIGDSDGKCAEVSKEAMDIIDKWIKEYNDTLELEREIYQERMAIGIAVSVVAGMLLVIFAQSLIG